MRILFLILLSACYVPSGNNGNGNNRRNQADTSSGSASTTDCARATDENDNAFFCVANDAIVYGCVLGNSCWYEAGDIHVNISDCSDQRSIDTAVLKIEDDCGGFYTK